MTTTTIEQMLPQQQFSGEATTLPTQEETQELLCAVGQVYDVGASEYFNALESRLKQDFEGKTATIQSDYEYNVDIAMFTDQAQKPARYHEPGNELGQPALLEMVLENHNRQRLHDQNALVAEFRGIYESLQASKEESRSSWEVAEDLHRGWQRTIESTNAARLSLSELMSQRESRQADSDEVQSAAEIMLANKTEVNERADILQAGIIWLDERKPTLEAEVEQRPEGDDVPEAVLEELDALKRYQVERGSDVIALGSLRAKAAALNEQIKHGSRNWLILQRHIKELDVQIEAAQIVANECEQAERDAQLRVHDHLLYLQDRPSYKSILEFCASLSREREPSYVGFSDSPEAEAAHPSITVDVRNRGGRLLRRFVELVILPPQADGTPTITVDFDKSVIVPGSVGHEPPTVPA